MYKKVGFVAISLGMQAGSMANKLIEGNAAACYWFATMLVVSLVLVLLILKDEVDCAD